MYRYSYEKMVQDCLECIDVLNENDDMDLMLRVYPNDSTIAIDDCNNTEDNNQLLFIKFCKDEEEHEYEDVHFDKIHIDTNTDCVSSLSIIKFIEAIGNIYENYGFRHLDIKVDGISFKNFKQINE